MTRPVRSTHGFARRACASALALLLATPGSALARQGPPPALPQGGQAAHGTVTIGTPSGSQMVVTQDSPFAIVNWSDFTIGAGGQVTFDQPNALAAILNRVTGGNLSRIDGQLLANGRVYLINPHGVVVGPDGVIDTAAFIGSTLNTSDAAFMAGGALTFSGDAVAGIENLGVIRASTGDVVLLAPIVVNRGTISAPGGTAALASGREVLLVPDSGGSLIIQASIPAADGVAIDNAGVITAAQAELRAAGSPFALAVNNSGLISATSLSSHGGRVVLDAGDGAAVNSGTLAAKHGDRGGAVDVLGGSVTLAGGSLIDASGASGGGTVRVGGGWHGADTSVPNARTTTVEAGAVIRADATAKGDGGSVVVWADGQTRFEGRIQARGGAAGGDGGQAEVSGKQLTFRGRADLTAPKGRTGTLLLDPASVDIDADAAAHIVATLDTASVTVQADNDITVNAPISHATTNQTLSLFAPAIAVNAGIFLPNGTLQFLSPFAAGSLTSAAGAAITAQTVNIAEHSNVTLAGAVTAGLLSIENQGATTANITIDNAANAIGMLDFFATGNNYTGGDITITSNTAMQVTGELSTGGGLTLAANGNLTLNAALSIGGQTTLAAIGANSAFINQVGANLAGGTGRIVIYTGTDAGGFTDGGLGYATVYGVVPFNDPQGTGNVVYVATSLALPLLTITADDKQMVYGNAAPAFTATFTGGSAADLTLPVQFVVLNGSFTNGNFNAGTYTIQPFGAASDTHQLVFLPGTLVVTPAPLLIGAQNATSIYGNSVPSFTPVFSGLVNGDTAGVVSGLQLTSAATSASGVGSYAIVPSGASAANYAITYANGTHTITPAQLMVLVQDVTRLYGGANPPLTALISGLVNNDSPSVVSGLSFSTSATTNSGVGHYAITASGGTAGPNYTLVYIPGTLVINPAPLTVTTSSASQVYGKALFPVVTNSYSGLVAGDTPESLGLGVAVVGPATLGAGGRIPAGTYSTILAGSAQNYAITYIPGVVTITPAPLTIGARDAQRYLGDANPAFSAWTSGLLPGDELNLTFSTPATASSPAGTYRIVPLADNPNYDITYVEGTLTIDSIVIQVPMFDMSDFEERQRQLFPTTTATSDVRVTIQGTGLNALENNAPSVVARAMAQFYALDPTMAASEKDFIDRYRYLLRNNMLGADFELGKLMPFLVAEAKDILDRDPSTWTREERAFIDYMTEVVMTQKRRAAEQAQQQLDAWKLEQRQVAETQGLVSLAYTQPVPPDSFLEQAQSGVALDSQSNEAFAGLITAAAGMTVVAASAAAVVAAGAAKAVVAAVMPNLVAVAAAAVKKAAIAAAIAGTTSAATAGGGTAAAGGAAVAGGAGAILGAALVVVAMVTAGVVTAVRVADARDYDDKMAQAAVEAQKPVTANDLKALLANESGQQRVFTYLLAHAANNDAARKGGK